MSRTHTATSALAITLLAGAASANPVQGRYSDVPTCDNHGLLEAREELGTLPLFPADELIDAVSTFTQVPACPADDPTMINSLVVITNLSGREWTDLFYVADPETGFSNVDGSAGSFAAPGIETRAFRIDSVGTNRPLVFESMTPDNVFEVGETWQFIVDDYTNALGLPAAALGSLDFSGASGGDPISAASIVQFVPAPSSLTLLAAGVLSAARRRR